MLASKPQLNFVCLQENQRDSDNTEISVKSTGTGIPEDQFCIVNLNSGLKTRASELLVCYLKVCICYHWHSMHSLYK